MKHYKTVTIEIDELESVECDVCKTKYDDQMEVQEFIQIDFIGGYSSVFGDGTNVKIDICQHCFKIVTEGYIQKGMT